jgi:hypothetical protein
MRLPKNYKQPILFCHSLCNISCAWTVAEAISTQAITSLSDGSYKGHTKDSMTLLFCYQSLAKPNSASYIVECYIALAYD